MTKSALDNSLDQRYRDILERIESTARSAHRKAQDITLVAVSKQQPLEAIERLYQLGHRDFGENYAQELLEKAQKLSEKGLTDIRWHFIGHLQTNKIKKLIAHLSFVHTVDSQKLAQILSKHWETLKRDNPLPVFVEVNVHHEPSKSGILLEEAPALTAKIAEDPHLSLQGLMCIPSASADPRSGFISLRLAEINCRPHTRGKCSMGMSDDFEIAIREGATHIRVGTALFGPRKQSG